MVSGVEMRGLLRDGDGDSDLILSLGENAKSAMFNLPLKLGGARSVSAETASSSSSSSSFMSSIVVCNFSGSYAENCLLIVGSARICRVSV